MGAVHVDPEQLNAMAGRCTETAENIDTGLRNLVDKIQGLSNQGLAGQANVALQSSSAELSDGLKKVLDALNGIAEKISSANTRLAAEDEEAAQTINTAAGAGGDQSVANALRAV